MAYVIGNLKPMIKVPFGVDAISDGIACLELAAGVGADYVRGTFSGVYVGDGGFYNPNWKVWRRCVRCCSSTSRFPHRTFTTFVPS